MKNYFLITVLCFVASLTLSAQSIYYDYGQDNFLRLEFNRPIFNNNDFGANPNIFSFESYLNGEFRVGKKNKIAFEIPYSRFTLNSDFGSFSSNELGNIAIAYQIRDLAKPSYIEFKVRVPTANDFGLFLADYTERFTATFPDLLSFEGSYTYEIEATQGLYYRFKPGLKLLIPISDSFSDDAEGLLDLNALIGYKSEKFDINGGITSTWILTESGADFDDRVLRQLFTTFTYNAGAVKPGILLRIPLGDNIAFGYNISVGIHVAYTFPTKTLDEPVIESSGL